jgi:hypothetical protein
LALTPARCATSRIVAIDDSSSPRSAASMSPMSDSVEIF